MHTRQSNKRREYRRGNKKFTIQRNWQHREHKTKKEKKPHNTICVGHHYTQTNTNHVNKTGDLLQTTGGKDEPNIALCKHRTKDQQKRKRSI